MSHNFWNCPQGKWIFCSPGMRRPLVPWLVMATIAQPQLTWNSRVCQWHGGDDGFDETHAGGDSGAGHGKEGASLSNGP